VADPRAGTVADAWKKFGVPVPFDATNGNGIGSLWIQNPIDPKDETRSYARTAYHDKAAQRKNYHLVVEHQVTKILFDKHKRAIGVAVRLPPPPPPPPHPRPPAPALTDCPRSSTPRDPRTPSRRCPPSAR